jgi:hypothetical protein
MGPTGCVQKSVRNYCYTLRNIQKSTDLVYFMAEPWNHACNMKNRPIIHPWLWASCIWNADRIHSLVTVIQCIWVSKSEKFVHCLQFLECLAVLSAQFVGSDQIYFTWCVLVSYKMHRYYIKCPDKSNILSFTHDLSGVYTNNG